MVSINVLYGDPKAMAHCKPLGSVMKDMKRFFPGSFGVVCIILTLLACQVAQAVPTRLIPTATGTSPASPVPEPPPASPTIYLTPDKTPPTITNIKTNISEYCVFWSAPGVHNLIVFATIQDPSGVASAYLKERYLGNGGYAGNWGPPAVEGNINDAYNFSVWISEDYNSPVWNRKADRYGKLEYQISAYDNAGNLGKSDILSLPVSYNCP